MWLQNAIKIDLNLREGCMDERSPFSREKLRQAQSDKSDQVIILPDAVHSLGLGTLFMTE